MEEIKSLIQKGRPALATTAQTTETLRSSHPEITVTMPGYSKDDFVKAGLSSEYAASIWSNSDFNFEDWQKMAHRRALYAANNGNFDRIFDATCAAQEADDQTIIGKKPYQKQSDGSARGIEKSGGPSTTGSVCA